VHKTFYTKRCHKHQHSLRLHQTWHAVFDQGDEDILKCSDFLIIASQMNTHISSPVGKFLNKFSSFSEH
jgi:hypothetical protein